MGNTPRFSLLLVAAVGLGVGVTAGLLATDGGETTEPEKRVLIAEGSDNLPNRSARDWVTYADYVVLVQAVGEKEIPPTKSELEHGEGLILRNVTLRVHEVLWARANVSHTAPTSFEWTAYGWQFSDGDPDNRVMMAGDDEPRVEAGHRYIIALVWEEARCPPGTTSQRGGEV